MIGRSWRERHGTWWWAILVIVIPVAGLTAAAAWIVPWLVDATTPSDQLEVVRIALTVGAGTGGIVALVLAGRRQWSTEQAHKATEHDSIERRITDLYTKSVDQLGSDHAAVRLGGLYALERLASTTPSQERTIGNVICSYIRMPYTTPPKLDNDASEEERKEHDKLTQEFEVRQTALDILTRHNSLHHIDEHWPSLIISLMRANLKQMNLSGADLAHAMLAYADLSEASLNGADLKHANLASAILKGARLPKAALEKSWLPFSDLTKADLSGANMRSAHLAYADLTGAYLAFADLSGADLTGAKLTGADLTQANLTGAGLAGADLTGTDLTDTDLLAAATAEERMRP